MEKIIISLFVIYVCLAIFEMVNFDISKSENKNIHIIIVMCFSLLAILYLLN